jgi:hypothetical protein
MKLLFSVRLDLVEEIHEAGRSSKEDSPENMADADDSCEVGADGSSSQC